MPYLPVDPQDIGCSYEAVIRVNSQSGKSGSAWLIEQNHGLKLPRALQQDFSQHVQQETDTHGKEMTQNALWQLFRTRYGLVRSRAALLDYKATASRTASFRCRQRCVTGETRRLQGHGNGLLSAAASGLSAL
jgi:2-isopropylmalate synthase